MIYKNNILISVFTVSMLVSASQASAECFAAKGKITNNALPYGMTQGVVALSLGEGSRTQRLKCALVGVPQSPIAENNFLPRYKHTVVCDNKVDPSNEVYAQATFDTQIISLTPDSSCSFSFEEISVPTDDPSFPARGEFSSITADGSQLDVSGYLNCAGGITMKFDGQLCFE